MKLYFLNTLYALSFSIAIKLPNIERKDWNKIIAKARRYGLLGSKKKNGKVYLTFANYENSQNFYIWLVVKYNEYVDNFIVDYLKKEF